MSSLSTTSFSRSTVQKRIFSQVNQEDRERTKTQCLVASNKQTFFFQTDLNGKTELLTCLSAHEVYWLLKKDRGQSLIEAVALRHVFFSACLNKLSEDLIYELCTIKNNQDNTVLGVTLVQTSNIYFLVSLLNCFKTARVLKSFFRLHHHPSSGQRKKSNIFCHLLGSNEKLQMLALKAFSCLRYKEISTIFEDFRKFEELSSQTTFSLLQNLPFSIKKMNVLFELLIRETHRNPFSRDSPIFTLIINNLDSIPPSLKACYFQKNLFKIIQKMNSSGSHIIGSLLDLIIFPDHEVTVAFLKMEDQFGNTFLERILWESVTFMHNGVILDLTELLKRDRCFIDLLFIPSQTCRNNRQIFSLFLEAVVCGKIDLNCLEDELIADAILQHFSSYPEEFGSWLERLCDLSLKTCSTLFLILIEERKKAKWENSLFSLNLHFLNNEKVSRLFNWLVINQYDFSTIREHLTQGQIEYLQETIAQEVQTFLSLDEQNDDSFFTYIPTLLIYSCLEVDKTKLLSLINSNSFSLLIRRNESTFISIFKNGFYHLMNSEIEELSMTSQVLFSECYQRLPQNAKKSFLLFCIHNQISVPFLPINEAIDLLISLASSLSIINDPKVRTWLSRDIQSAKESYWKIEELLLFNLASCAKQEITTEAALNIHESLAPYLDFVSQKYNKNQEIAFYLPGGISQIAHIKIMLEIALESQNSSHSNVVRKFIKDLIFTRLNLITLVAFKILLVQPISNDENLFVKLLRLSSNMITDQTKMIEILEDKFSTDFLLKLFQTTIYKTLQSHPGFDRQYLLPMFHFISSKPRSDLKIWIRKVLLQEGRAIYQRINILRFSLQMQDSSNQNQISIQWMLCNLLRTSQNLIPYAPTNHPIPNYLLMQTTKEMTKKVVNELAAAREDNSLSLQEKVDLVAPLLIFSFYSNINYVSFFSEFLKEPEFSRSPSLLFFSIVELKLLRNFLLSANLSLENYPKIALPLAPTVKVDIQSLIPLFEEYTFTDESSLQYMDLSEMYAAHCRLLTHRQIPEPIPTKEEYKKLLNDLLRKLILETIPQREALTGLSNKPEIREEQYEQIEKDLQIIASFLFQQKEKAERGDEIAKVRLQGFLPILAGMKATCATGWKGAMEEMLDVIATEKNRVHYSQLLTFFQELYLIDGENSKQLDLNENYLEYCKECQTLQKPVLSFEQYKKYVEKILHQLVHDIIPNRSQVAGISPVEKTRNIQYEKIQKNLQILASFILKQKEYLLLDEESQKKAKKIISTIFSRLALIDINDPSWAKKIGNFVKMMESQSGDINPYTIKGKILLAIRKAYNNRIRRMKNSSNVHWNLMYKKLLWQRFPFLIDNQAILSYEDPLFPQLQNQDQTIRKVTYEDISSQFFSDSFNQLQATLMKDLNSSQSDGLKAECGRESIYEITKFEIKKYLRYYASSLSPDTPIEDKKIEEFALELIPILYDNEYNFNELALALLLQHFNLQVIA